MPAKLQKRLELFTKKNIAGDEKQIKYLSPKTATKT